MCSKFPTFADLGKDCRDLFSKCYHVGLFKIIAKNETCHGVEVKATGTHKIEDKTAVGDVEMKACYPIPGLCSVHNWDTENNLKSEVSMKNVFPGGKVSVFGRLQPDTVTYGGGIKLNYTHPKFLLDADVDSGNLGSEESNPVVGASVVTGYAGLVAAYRGKYDTVTGDLTANDAALAYVTRDYGLTLLYDNLTILNGFYFHRVNRDVELGVHAKLLGEEGATFLAIGGKYTFSGFGHTLRAKVNNDSILGLGVELKILQGFHACASADVDMKVFAAGPHKIGFGLEFGC